MVRDYAVYLKKKKNRQNKSFCSGVCLIFHVVYIHICNCAFAFPCVCIHTCVHRAPNKPKLAKKPNFYKT